MNMISDPEMDPEKIQYRDHLAGSKKTPNPRLFNYLLDYNAIDFRYQPELYRVGVGEQGVLLVEPYKSEILPQWRFASPEEAQTSADTILEMFHIYRSKNDFIGMDMARKFLQMGYTRARRYANHYSGKKYNLTGAILPTDPDPIKVHAAQIFHAAWKNVEANTEYTQQRKEWKVLLG
jgi:hypothetical protein